MLFTIQVEANSIQEVLAKLGFADSAKIETTVSQNFVPLPPTPAVTALPPVIPAAPVVPVAPPVQSAPPMQPPVAPPPPVVPTAPVAYTQDQLLRAAAPIMDAGKMAELQQVMASFGVTHMGQLPPERYGEFANALRGLGAKL